MDDKHDFTTFTRTVKNKIYHFINGELVLK